METTRYDTPPPGFVTDAGFTMVEVIVSTAVIGIVMAASVLFFASTLKVTNVSGGQQTAVQLATDGIEAARAVPIADLRAAVLNSNGRWIAPDATGDGDPEQPVRNGVRFARGWAVTNCWLPPAGGSCGAQAGGYLPFLRVVVTVTWPDSVCSPSRCSFITSTVLSNAPRDPVFVP